ncbi:MAG: amino acid adenylation domain-containing protein, partial [Planctomycetales bacterium]|nr:amino acid adenylation domain-containing protein [Planctomycetales bacterium]
INFVDSLWELFAAWNQGRPTLLLPSARASDLNKLVLQLNEHGVTRLLLVPSLLRAVLDSKIPLAERLPKLQHVICSGEPLAAALSKGFADQLPGVKLTNLYGTTEVWDATQADSFQFSAPQHIPIGRPLPNTRMVVLDTRFRLAPRGAVGELYVGGEGLARAYLRRPGLTASHFVPDPFDTRPGRRLYRTGDLVRWRDDGCLDSQGRIDHQLSIRGYRAEPAEIEAAMCQHPKIRAAAVLLESDGILTGFFESEAESQPTLEEVRAVCRRFLPAALIPSFFVSLTKLPMTPSGKVDRKRLPDMPRERITSGRQLVLPRSETERQLAEIWKDILSLSELGVDDNFFDLGGHSLQATRMLSRVQQQFGREVSLRVFFNEPTISACAENLETAASVVDSPVLKLNLIETPVSPAQQRIWVLQQLAPDLPHYHLAILIRVNGFLDRELLNNALQRITHRHDVLRTSIRSTAEGLVQLVTQCDTAIESVDLRQQAADVRERELRNAALDIARLPFDLERPPLFRCCVFRLDEDQHAVLVVAHHIIMDGWSVGVLAAELYELYQAQRDKRSPRLPMLPVQYTDYSVWQQCRIEQSEQRERLEQWCQRLADAPQSLNLPLTRARASSPSFAGAILESNMPAATVHKLRRWGQREGASLFMALLSTFQQLLHELSGQDDLLIGCPVAGRIRPELEPMLGVFTNTLVLRSRHTAQQSAREHLRATRRACLWAFENQETPFEQIVSRISQQRDLSRQPLVQVLLTLQNTPTPAVQTRDLELAAETFDLGIARFDLTIYATEIQDSLRIVWEYSTDLFDRSLIADFQDQWLKRIEQLGAEEDEGPVSASCLTLPDVEVEHALNRCGALIKALETDDPLALFRRYVEHHPTATAILASDGIWSYQRLAEQAAGWASCLEDVGIQRGEVVAVSAMRSGNTIAAMLAIWSVGGAYLPLMPDLPMSHKVRVCDDARVRFALALERDDTQYSETIHIVHWKPSEQGILGLWNAKNRLQVEPPRDLAAYVLSTSGSSGSPQAVCMSRKSLCGLLAWMQRDSNARMGDVTLQYAPLSFDVSFQEIFSTLICGGTLFIPSDELRRDIKALARATREQGVARAFLPTALLQDFVAAASDEHPGSLCEIIVAGEALRISPEIRSFFKRHAHIKLLNHYGPTETHVVTSEALGSQPEDWGEAPPIGRPIPGAMTWVLDTSLTACDTLAPGELYIGGTSVGLGYIGRPRQTAERFVPDPETQYPGGRMFKTGDRVRWLPEGSLEFLGRIDRQVKVRGYRIEPSEVELALLNCPGVNECVVLAQSGSSLVTHLCCYVVPAKAGLKVDDLQAFLRLRLPEHMVPTQWSVVDSLPRNHHGKVDLRALPPVTPEATRSICSTPPKTTTQRRVAAIWRELLGLESIGINEDFFSIGGHSLTAARMIARIRGEFAVEVPLRFLFERPTIEGLATALDHGQFADPLPPLRSGLATMPIASSAQRRLWALHQLDPGSPAYNLATAIWIHGALDYDALQTAVSEILARHEVLRSKWVDGSNGPLPQPAPSEPFVLDVQYPNWSETELQQQVALAASSFARRPFDLSSGQLFRLQLLQLGPDQHVGLVACHHLAADGWSVSILLSEIASLYQAASQGHQSPLAPLTLRYADYAAWEAECLKSPRLDRQREYWMQKLAGVPDLILTPISNQIRHTWQGDVLDADIPTELHRALAALAQTEGATLYMTLLSGLQALLFHYTSQNDFCIGSVVSGRRQALTERLIGPFVNMLALRADLKGDPSFRDLLRRVRHTMLEALANQDLPFEETIEGRSVPIQLVFVFHNQPMPVIQTGALRLEPTAVSLGAARFDLTIDAQERGGGGIDVRLEFRSDAFDRDTIKQFFQAWVTLMESAVSNP